MQLLVSDITPIDAGLDRAIPWPDHPADPLALQPPGDDDPNSDEATIVGRKHAWYEPRLSALRRLIAEQQSWETR